jgi:hypothetical protein
MNLNFFLNDIFFQNSNIKFNKTVWIIYIDVFNFFSKIFKEYFPKSSVKSSKKTDKCGSCYPICIRQWDI